MKKPLILALAILGATSCGNKEEDTPMQAALNCYLALIQERWDDYIDGTSDGVILSADMRRDRIDVVRDYMEVQKKTNGGITAAEPIRCDMVNDSTAFVYVRLSFAEAKSEDIYVPVVRVDGHWLVR